MANTTLTVKVLTDDDVELEHELPARFEVCARCEGHGCHLNPSIGQHAYSAEEFYEAFSDEDDRAAYFTRGGMYDVTCEECKGQRVVPVVDEARLNSEQKKVHALWQKQEDEHAQWEYESRAERMMEARMLGEEW